MSTDTSPVQQPERPRDLERFITFIDAIVAIALLVLPLVDLATEIAPGDSVHHLLTTHKAPIGAFLLLSAIALLLTRQPQLRDNEHAPDVWGSCATSITLSSRSW